MTYDRTGRNCLFINPILHTVWWENHTLTLELKILYFAKNPVILHTFLTVCPESKKILKSKPKSFTFIAKCVLKTGNLNAWPVLNIKVTCGVKGIDRSFELRGEIRLNRFVRTNWRLGIFLISF
jgi:hypothetical protein